jgi:chromosome segregation ATPase
MHTEPMRFIDANGTVYDNGQFDIMADDCDMFKLHTRECYCGVSPRRKPPNVKRAARYSTKRRSMYLQSMSQDDYDVHKDISTLQEKLNDAINESMWKEKEGIRLQNQIEHLQKNPNLTRVERAFAATTRDIASMEVSVDVDHDDEDTKPSGDHQQQLQQLFMTLQHERKMHQEDLLTLNTQINLLQKERELSKAEYLSLSHKLQDQESKNTNVESAPTVNVTDAADMTSTCPANTTHNTTLETMLQKYNELDDDSKKMLTQHALMTDNADLQRRLMELRASQGNNTTLAKLTKEIIKLADTYKYLS